MLSQCYGGRISQRDHARHCPFRKLPPLQPQESAPGPALCENAPAGSAYGRSTPFVVRETRCITQAGGRCRTAPTGMARFNKNRARSHRTRSIADSFSFAPDRSEASWCCNSEDRNRGRKSIRVRDDGHMQRADSRTDRNGVIRERGREPHGEAPRRTRLLLSVGQHKQKPERRRRSAPSGPIST